MTTCQGLSAVFTCGINETTTILWFINGIHSRSSSCYTLKPDGFMMPVALSAEMFTGAWELLGVTAPLLAIVSLDGCVSEENSTKFVAFAAVYVV